MLLCRSGATGDSLLSIVSLPSGRADTWNVSPPSLSESGTLVRARGREWVVLPDFTDELLMLRPVGGLDEEITAVLPAVEPVESATFRLPSREDLGDFTSGRLLRDAARLSTRAAAGPCGGEGKVSDGREYRPPGAGRAAANAGRRGAGGGDAAGAGARSAPGRLPQRSLSAFPPARQSDRLHWAEERV